MYSFERYFSNERALFSCDYYDGYTFDENENMIPVDNYEPSPVISTIASTASTVTPIPRVTQPAAVDKVTKGKKMSAKIVTWLKLRSRGY